MVSDIWRRRVILLTVLLSAVVGGCTSSPASDAAPTYTFSGDGRNASVTDVVDGDTVDVRFAGGGTDTVRLLAVDTPEVYSEVSPDEFPGVSNASCLDEYADRASEYAASRLSGESVRLVFDSVEGRRGSYDRLLAYIHVGGEDFNQELVSEGYARVYTEGDAIREQEYVAAMEQARQADRGLWSCS